MSVVIFKNQDDQYDLLDPYYGGHWVFDKGEVEIFLRLLKLYEENNYSDLPADSMDDDLRNMLDFVREESIPMDTHYFVDSIMEQLDSCGKGIITPPDIVLEINRKCNYSCPWCYIPTMNNDEKIEMSVNEIEKYLIVPMIHAGARQWTISGGEPSVTKEKTISVAKSITECTVKEYGVLPRISLLTNGYFFSEYGQEYWEANIKSVQFQLSSPYEEQENLLRSPLSSINSYRHVIDGVKKAKEIGFFTSINMVVSPQNMHSIEDMIILAADLKADLLRVTPVVPAGKAKNNNIRLELDNYEKIVKQIEKVSKLKSTQLLDIYFPSMEIEDDRPMWCGLGFLDFYMAYDGLIYPCNNLIEEDLLCDVRSIREADAVEIWRNSENLLRFRNYNISNIQNECGKCQSRSICVGNCIARCWHQFGVFELMSRPKDCYLL